MGSLGPGPSPRGTPGPRRQLCCAGPLLLSVVPEATRWGSSSARGPGRPPAQEAAGAPRGPGQAGSSLFVRSGSSAGRNLEITSYPVLSARDCGADRHGPRFCLRLRNGRLLTRPSPPRAAAGAGPRGGVRRCGPCAVPHGRHVPCDARVVPPSGRGDPLGRRARPCSVARSACRSRPGTLAPCPRAEGVWEPRPRGGAAPGGRAAFPRPFSALGQSRDSTLIPPNPRGRLPRCLPVGPVCPSSLSRNSSSQQH